MKYIKTNINNMPKENKSILKRQSRQAEYRERKRAAGFVQKNFWIHLPSFNAGLNGAEAENNDEFSYRIGLAVANEQKKENENEN